MNQNILNVTLFYKYNKLMDNAYKLRYFDAASKMRWLRNEVIAHLEEDAITIYTEGAISTHVNKLAKAITHERHTTKLHHKHT